MNFFLLLRQSRFELNRKLEEVNAHLEEQVRHGKEFSIGVPE